MLYINLSHGVYSSFLYIFLALENKRFLPSFFFGIQERGSIFFNPLICVMSTKFSIRFKGFYKAFIFVTQC